VLLIIVLSLTTIVYIFLYLKLLTLPISSILVGIFGGLISNSLKNYSSDQIKKRRLQKYFSNYLHPEIVRGIVDLDKEINLGGEQTEIVILFSDLRNFTSLTENITPRELVEIMNEYFDLACREIQDKNGTIDKFIGDAVMAFWNAPLLTDDFNNQAVISSINFINEFNKLEVKWREKFQLKVPIGLGIGIHQGNAIVGNFGSHNRFNYTAIGDSVNLASRVESLCKYYGRELIITDAVYSKISLKDKFIILESVRVKGKDIPVNLYTWIGKMNNDEILIWNLGIQNYNNKEYLKAEEYLKSLEPKYKMAQRLLEHSKKFIIDSTCDGIWDFEHK
jgi:adenylate cyclase